MMNDRWIQGYVGVLTGQIVIVGFGGVEKVTPCSELTPGVYRMCVVYKLPTPLCSLIRLIIFPQPSPSTDDYD